MAYSSELVITLERIKDSLPKVLRTLKWSALIDLLITVAVAISFLFTGNFSAVAYSDRLFMMGIAVLGLGMLVVLSLWGINQDFWMPFRAPKEHDGPKIIQSSAEQREHSEKRYNLSVRIWITGIGCLLLSAITYLILTSFGIGV